MKNQYRTKELSEAAALLTKGQQIVDIERQGRICWFIFNNKELCEDLANKFFFSDLSVNARDYFESVKRLKNRIFTY